MTSSNPTDFLAGVIEGFYGPPWSPNERRELVDNLAAWGLNTYLYGPKDDLHHRALWRELYSGADLAAIQEWIAECRNRGVHFIYALAPGLDIHFSDPTETEHLKERCQQLLRLGCRHFALLFDDIPDRLRPDDLQRWGSPAAAQAVVTNSLMTWLQQQDAQTRLLFCPTPYCGRMAHSGLGGPGYLEILGRSLQSDIDVFWTGPEIISREISVAHIRELQQILRRKPVIWDNLHANDYDGRRFFCGPYAGRPLELRGEVRGILTNPNCELPLNRVPLQILGAFVRAEGVWNERLTYERAMGDWLVSFATHGRPMELADLIRFGDCHYLPYEEGHDARAFFNQAADLLGREPSTWGAEAEEFLAECQRWRRFFHQMSELRDRPLYHALLRRIWDLREEIDLLNRYVEFKRLPENADRVFHSDYHLPGTYRGGMLTRLQGLLVQHPDGSFLPQNRSEQPVPISPPKPE